MQTQCAPPGKLRYNVNALGHASSIAGYGVSKRIPSCFSFAGSLIQRLRCAVLCTALTRDFQKVSSHGVRASGGRLSVETRSTVCYYTMHALSQLAHARNHTYFIA